MRAALQEQHLVIVRDLQQVAQILLGLVDDLLISLGAVAHFHNRHSGALVIEHFVRGFAQNLLGQHRRAGGKVIHTVHISDNLHRGSK